MSEFGQVNIEPDPRTAKWLLLLPRFSFLLFIFAVMALLWLSDRADTEEQKATLISDMLWLEQSLRFVLIHNEELLGQIETPSATSDNGFGSRARTLIDNQTGLIAVSRLDPEGQVTNSMPRGEAYSRDHEFSRLALSVGKPVYGSVYDEAGWRIDVYIPAYNSGTPSGIVRGTYALQKLIEQSVPWWLAERYRIIIEDVGGNILASRSKVEAPAGDGSYRLAFEPPGQGLYLEATPYRAPPPLAGKLLSAALVLLAISVLWSLWALRRHIHRRHEVEHALRTEHAFRKAMEDSVQTGLRARDLKGRITYVNPAFCAMVGWSEEELIDRSPPMPYWVDEDLEKIRELHDRILAGEGPDSGFEVSFKRRNGTVFPVLIHEAPLIDGKGRQTGWMSSIIDLTDQKRTADLARQQQERLQATQRLIIMGEMASSLAHELNQPLAAISGYQAGCLNMLDGEKPDLKAIREALTKSAGQAQRAGKVIRRIYEFVRRAEPKLEVCNPSELIEEVCLLVEPDARRQGIRLRRQVDEDLVDIQGDRVLLGQVLLNLMRNGIDAMRDVKTEERVLTIAAHGDSQQVHVSVADRGHGIPPEVANHLFEPFFTTKSEGMGMGLNICRSVVEGHQGRLWIDENPGRGSVVHILLPIERR